MDVAGASHPTAGRASTLTSLCPPCGLSEAPGCQIQRLAYEQIFCAGVLPPQTRRLQYTLSSEPSAIGLLRVSASNPQAVMDNTSGTNQMDPAPLSIDTRRRRNKLVAIKAGDLAHADLTKGGHDGAAMTVSDMCRKCIVTVHAECKGISLSEIKESPIQSVNVPWFPNAGTLFEVMRAAGVAEARNPLRVPPRPKNKRKKVGKKENEWTRWGCTAR